MNKIMMLSAAVLALTLGAGVAFAEDAAAPKGKGHGGKAGMHHFKQMDTNGDKVVTKAEFLTHAEDRFSKMDADGNGEVTLEEAKEVRKNLREKMKETMEKRGMGRGPKAKGNADTSE